MKLLREEFGTSPLKITADNIFIFYDNTKQYYDIIWDDENEIMYSIHPSTNDTQDPYPFTITATDYSMIQFIEPMLTPKQAIEWIESKKSKMTDETYTMAIKMFKDTVTKRSYGSSLVNEAMRYANRYPTDNK